LFNLLLVYQNLNLILKKRLLNQLH